jgi:predicted P-loop ATPase/GTPase
VAHELPVPVHGRWLLWRWMRRVVSLGLQVGHSVFQILQ